MRPPLRRQSSDPLNPLNRQLALAANSARESTPLADRRIPSETPRVGPSKRALPLQGAAVDLPAVEPVFTDVALDHEAAHIVGLPADTVQRGRRHLPSVPKQRRNGAGRGSLSPGRK